MTLPDNERDFFKLIGAIVATVLVIALAVSAVREHDARILAEQTVKESTARVETLEKQVQDVDRAGKAEIAKIRKRAQEVKTTPEAIAAIPDVSTLPLNARPLPDAPSSVPVEAVPLFQELSKCKETAVGLLTCQQKADLTEKVIEEKDIQIAALKKRKTFWKRFGSTVKNVGIGVAIGYGIHAVTR